MMIKTDVASSDSDELSPGFISENDDCIDAVGLDPDGMSLMAKMLPVTARRTKECRRQKLKAHPK
jgi:hypothetical protein